MNAPCAVDTTDCIITSDKCRRLPETFDINAGLAVWLMLRCAECLEEGVVEWHLDDPWDSMLSSANCFHFPFDPPDDRDLTDTGVVRLEVWDVEGAEVTDTDGPDIGVEVLMDEFRVVCER